MRMFAFLFFFFDFFGILENFKKCETNVKMEAFIRFFDHFHIIGESVNHNLKFLRLVWLVRTETFRSWMFYAVRFKSRNVDMCQG